MLFKGPFNIESNVQMSKLVGPESEDALELMYIRVCAHVYPMIPKYRLHLAASRRWYEPVIYIF